MSRKKKEAQAMEETNVTGAAQSMEETNVTGDVRQLAMPDDLEVTTEFVREVSLMEEGEQHLIISAVRNIRNYKRITVEGLVGVGDELRAVRALFPRGSWGIFLEQVGITPKTAQRYMKAAEYAAAHPDKVMDMTPKLLYDASKNGDTANQETMLVNEDGAMEPPPLSPFVSELRGEQYDLLISIISAIAPLYDERPLELPAKEVVRLGRRLVKEVLIEGIDKDNPRAVALYTVMELLVQASWAGNVDA